MLDAISAGYRSIDTAQSYFNEEQVGLAIVRIYDEKKKTIVVKSCAPAPLWELLKKLQSRCAGKTIASEICRNEDVIQYLAQNECDIALVQTDEAANVTFYVIYREH